MCVSFWYCFFFFQAEDGIRDADVTGVQTCALPIWPRRVTNLPATLDALEIPSDPGPRQPPARLIVTAVQYIVVMGHHGLDRSGERRVGEEGRSRGAPDH